MATFKTVLFIVVIFGHCNSQVTSNQLTAFRSTLPFEEVKGTSGLYLQKAPKFSEPFSNSLTFCMRFKFSRLDSRILELSALDESDSVDFLWLGIWAAKFSFVALKSSWLLKDSISGEFDIWGGDIWQSFCISYDSQTMEVSFIKVKNYL